MNRVRKAVEPPGEAKADWEIIMALANKLEIPGFYFESAEQIFEEVRQCTPQYAGMTYARLESQKHCIGRAQRKNIQERRFSTQRSFQRQMD